MNTPQHTSHRDDFWRILGVAAFLIVAVLAVVPAQDPAAETVHTAQATPR